MTAISWVTLKQVHDVLATSATEVFLAGRKRAASGLFAVKIENGAPSEFEQADPEVARGIRFGEPGVDERIREFFVECSALGSTLKGSIGFVPDVVVLVGEITYEPSTGAQPAEQRLLISVHTATASFPVAHPIVEGSARKCVLRPFPEQSRELSLFLESDDPLPSSPTPPKELQEESHFQQKLGEEAFATVRAAAGAPWREACLAFRIERAGGSVMSTLKVTLESGKVISLPVSGRLIVAIRQLVDHRAPQAQPWCGMQLTLSPEGACVGQFDYGPGRAA
jgi:hypothetical protein